MNFQLVKIIVGSSGRRRLLGPWTSTGSRSLHYKMEGQQVCLSNCFVQLNIKIILYYIIKLIVYLFKPEIEIWSLTNLSLSIYNFSLLFCQFRMYRFFREGRKAQIWWLEQDQVLQEIPKTSKSHILPVMTSFQKD